MGNTILTSNSKKDLRMIMPEIRCPKCNTRIYDNTSFFCYTCGTKLSPDIPENVLVPGKEKDRTKNYKTIIPERTSVIIRDDILSAPKPVPIQPLKKESRHDFFPVQKPAPIQPVKPVEVCAHCGSPIINKTRIFCENCGLNIREELSGEVSSILKHPVSNRIGLPGIHQNTENRTIKKQESVLNKETRELVQPKRGKLIVILAGIAILIIMLMLVFMLMTFWESLY